MAKYNLVKLQPEVLVGMLENDDRQRAIGGGENLEEALFEDEMVAHYDEMGGLDFEEEPLVEELVVPVMDVARDDEDLEFVCELLADAS